MWWGLLAAAVFVIYELHELNKTMREIKEEIHAMKGTKCY